MQTISMATKATKLANTAPTIDIITLNAVFLVASKYSVAITIPLIALAPIINTSNIISPTEWVPYSSTSTKIQ